jgi:hypothetical protein
MLESLIKDSVRHAYTYTMNQSDKVNNEVE